MSGAVIVTSCRTHEVAHRSVNWDRVAGRLDAAKTEVTLRVCHKFASQIHRRLLGILLLVKPFRRRMPDVDFGARDRLAGLVLHPTIDEKRRPGCRRSHDGAAVFRTR